MVNLRPQVMAFAGAAVVALSVTTDYLGELTGWPHPPSAIRKAGFVVIAVGLYFMLCRKS